jgi:hypothetical protein
MRVKKLLYKFVIDFSILGFSCYRKNDIIFFFMLHQYLPKLNTFFNGATGVKFFIAGTFTVNVKIFHSHLQYRVPHKPSVSEGNVCKFHENPICRGRILGRNSDKSQVLRVFVFDRKPCSLPYGLIKKSIQKLKSENSQDYAHGNINKIVSS